MQHLSVVVVQRGNPVADMPPHQHFFMLIFLVFIYLNFLSSLIIHFSIIIQSKTSIRGQSFYNEQTLELLVILPCLYAIQRFHCTQLVVYLL